MRKCRADGDPDRESLRRHPADARPAFPLGGVAVPRQLADGDRLARPQHGTGARLGDQRPPCLGRCAVFPAGSLCKAAESFDRRMRLIADFARHLRRPLAPSRPAGRRNLIITRGRFPSNLPQRLSTADRPAIPSPSIIFAGAEPMNLS